MDTLDQLSFGRELKDSLRRAKIATRRVVESQKRLFWMCNVVPFWYVFYVKHESCHVLVMTHEKDQKPEKQEH